MYSLTHFTKDDPVMPLIEHDDDVFHVFGINGINIDKIWKRVPSLMEEAGFPGQLLISSEKTDEKIKCFYKLSIKGQSAQGIEFYQVDNDVALDLWMKETGRRPLGIESYKFDNDVVHINLPWLASLGDIKLAFCVMKAIKELFPEMTVYLNENSNNPITLDRKKEDELLGQRIKNMISLLRYGFVYGAIMGVIGIRRQFTIPTTNPDCPIEELQKILSKVFRDFIEVQWKWENYIDAGLKEAISPEKEEITIRFLTNTRNIFVGVCDKLSLMNKDKSKLKIVDYSYFMKKMEGNPYYDKVDALQFAMRVMPADKWDALIDSLEGEEPHQVNTFTLKWNPAISSFRYDDYRDAFSQSPKGFRFNWSVHEWKKAKKGDHFYMIRVGDGQTGAVWRGVFTSDPYKDKDWSGKGREVYYVDMDIHELNEPDSEAFIPTAILQQEIPELDWTKGHSGMLLTNEQARILDRLWKKAKKKRRNTKE